MVIYTSCAVFILLALALVVASGYSLGAAGLFLGSAALLWKRPRLGLKRADYCLIAVLFFYFFATAASNLYHADRLRDYDASLRFLLAIPVLLLLLAYPARPAALWGGLALGAISGGIYGTWQHLVEGIDRSGGTTNAIQYSNICILLGLLCGPGVAWARLQKRRLFWTVLLALGCFWGLFGSVMSGTRGSWIALPFCAAILALYQAGRHGKRYLYLGLLLLLALIGTVYAIPQSGVEARTAQAVQEAQEYLLHENAHNTITSVGERLEMWRNALAMAPQHIWLGWGQRGYMQHKILLNEEGRLAFSVLEHSHAHNEYLDALVKHGMLGLLALLALYLMPLRLFLLHLKHSSLQIRPYALAGVLLMTSYLLFGLTTAFMTVNHGVMMLAFLVIILWSCMRAEERRSA